MKIFRPSRLIGFTLIAVLAAACGPDFPRRDVAGAQRLAAGDGGLLLPRRRQSAWRDGRVLTVIQAEGAASDLEAFTHAYARFIEARSLRDAARQ